MGRDAQEELTVIIIIPIVKSEKTEASICQSYRETRTQSENTGPDAMSRLFMDNLIPPKSTLSP